MGGNFLQKLATSRRQKLFCTRRWKLAKIRLSSVSVFLRQNFVASESVQGCRRKKSQFCNFLIIVLFAVAVSTNFLFFFFLAFLYTRMHTLTQTDTLANTYVIILSRSRTITRTRTRSHRTLTFSHTHMENNHTPTLM